MFARATVGIDRVASEQSLALGAGGCDPEAIGQMIAAAFVRREGEVDGRCGQMLYVELGRRRHSFLSVHSFTTRVITRCHPPMGAHASAGTMSRYAT
jgi:hypothetical protein